MSGTYIHILDASAVQATAQLVEHFRDSREAFEAEQMAEWGAVRYSHATFLADAAARHASDWSVYYLAHGIVNSRPPHPHVFMDVDLDAMYLDGEWLPAQPSGAALDEEILALGRARAAGGLRLEPSRSPEVEAVLEFMNLHPERRERFMAEIATRKLLRTPTELLQHLSNCGISPAIAQDVLLMNHLCNSRARRLEAPANGYPLWIVAGWDNYEGYLTGDECARLAGSARAGYLSVFARAANDADWTTPLVTRLSDALSRAAAAGPEALCIAVSSR